MANSSKWSLSLTEIGKSVGENDGNEFKVWLPKILPLVPFGKAKASAMVLNKSCYLNSDGCKPSIATKVRILNYIKIPVNRINSLKGKVAHGEGLSINVQNKNIEHMTVTGKIE